MRQTREPVFVQALISEPPVQGFNVGILVRLTGFNQFQRHTHPVRPGQHRSTRRLRAIVGPNDPGLPATCADLVEDANQVVSAHAVLGDCRHDLVRRIVDHHQALYRTARGHPVEYEV